MRVLLLIILLMAGLIANGQHWSPVPAGMTLHYQADTANTIGISVHADSTYSIAGNTFSELNLIGKPIDWAPGFQEGFIYQEHFMGNTILVTDTNSYLIGKSDTIRLDNKGAIGHSWPFGNHGLLTATIVAADTVPGWFGTDSVKTIEIGSGDTLIISKHFGILNFPKVSARNVAVKLVGIQDSVGMQVPTFFEIYNYEVGDEFYYTHQYGNTDGNFFNSQKKRITAKEILADSVIYRYVRPNYLHDTLYEVIYKQTIEAPFQEDWMSGMYDSARLPNNDYSFVSYTDSASCSGLFSNQLVKQYLYFNAWFVDSTYSIPAVNYDCYEYIAGLGIVCRYSYSIDSYSFSSLDGYTKGGVTYGYMPHDSLFNTTAESVLQISGFSLQPNPVNNKLHIESGINGQQQIRVFNLQGQMLLEEQVKGPQAHIDVSTLPAGIYLLQLQSEEYSATQKFVKQ